ncbi:DsbC family protein [Herbaspirillum huttiense]|uniref:DsbC family protein n=1 Tax=Herbaspirillum huttiense TaxID=863372 RepID=UPI002176CF17|nr:DsbC family protein [Herbaspirillum huttiense]UWE19355.1 DsbC family protein [Herbaspirillum huttiense]
MKKIIFAVLALFSMAHAHAGFIEDLHAKFPQTIDAQVDKSFGNFYSVVRGSEVLFVNEDLSILINGDVIDLKQNRSITSAIKEATRPRVPVKELNLKDAIKMGNGPDKIYVFSDPDCPYCKRLEGEFDKLHGVTIYIFPFPIVELHPNAANVAESIWCAKKPATAWHDYLIKQVKPLPANCDNPIDRNVALAQKFKLYGTPAIVLQDGSVIPGAVSAETLQAAIAKAKTQ